MATGRFGKRFSYKGSKSVEEEPTGWPTVYREPRRKTLARHRWGREIMESLLERQGNQCPLCGAPCYIGPPGPDQPTIDHIVPLSRGGKEKLQNIQAVHLHCNNERGSPRVDRHGKPIRLSLQELIR